MPSNPATLMGNQKKDLAKNHRVLETNVCSVCEGQQCDPPASVFKTACPASAGRRKRALPALTVILAWVFYSSFLFFRKMVKITLFTYDLINVTGSIICTQPFLQDYCFLH